MEDPTRAKKMRRVVATSLLAILANAPSAATSCMGWKGGPSGRYNVYFRSEAAVAPVSEMASRGTFSSSSSSSSPLSSTSFFLDCIPVKLCLETGDGGVAVGEGSSLAKLNQLKSCSLQLKSLVDRLDSSREAALGMQERGGWESLCPMASLLKSSLPSNLDIQGFFRICADISLLVNDANEKDATVDDVEGTIASLIFLDEFLSLAYEVKMTLSILDLRNSVSTAGFSSAEESHGKDNDDDDDDDLMRLPSGRALSGHDAQFLSRHLSSISRDPVSSFSSSSSSSSRFSGASTSSSEAEDMQIAGDDDVMSLLFVKQLITRAAQVAHRIVCTHRRREKASGPDLLQLSLLSGLLLLASHLFLPSTIAAAVRLLTAKSAAPYLSIEMVGKLENDDDDGDKVSGGAGFALLMGLMSRPLNPSGDCYTQHLASSPRAKDDFMEQCMPTLAQWWSMAQGPSNGCANKGICRHAS